MAYKPTSMPTASAPSLSVVRINDFYGCDLTNQPTNVDAQRSPDAQNMIRDVPGKVRKRMGYQTIYTLDGQINGFHKLNGAAALIHAGTKLYKVDADGCEAVYTDAADARSKSWEFDKKLVIADGKALLVYDGETVVRADTQGRVPILTISRQPNGGGTSYEGLNLLQPKFEEDFLVDADHKDAKVFQLSFGGLDEAAVTVQVMTADSDWADKTEGTDFTVDRETGAVTFTTAPGATPVSGTDNVKITASRTVAGYADRVNRCSIGIQFGVAGASDRLFLAGNPEFINYDWYSGQNDPTYWSDTAYSVLGQSDAAIVGYSVVNARLAAHKNGQDAERNCIVREGNLTDNQPAFPIVNILQGEGAIGPYTFGYLQTEPLFLTNLGVYAITAQDITGEKYSQLRSFFLNGKLLDEANLKDAYCCVYKDMYWLAVNDRVYVLDGLQASQTDRNAPYATRQYAGFYLTHIPARVLWENDGALWFGGKDGKVRKFYTDAANQTSYNDDGEAIYACWRTMDVSGKNVYRSKNFSRLYVELAAAVATSLKAFARISGVWEQLFEDNTSARYFDFTNLNFGKITFSCDDNPKTLGEKISIKKVDKAGFRIENGEVDEPFGLNNISIEYVETGYYKR